MLASNLSRKARRKYNRWALLVKRGDWWFFPGRYCWGDWEHSSPYEFPHRTFATRAEARAAREKLTSYRAEARVVRVVMTLDLAKGGSR